MHIVNSCITCGAQVGTRGIIFRHIWRKKCKDLANAKQIPIQNLFIDTTTTINCEEILDALGIHQTCCRISLITCMEFYDYLK